MYFLHRTQTSPWCNIEWPVCGCPLHHHSLQLLCTIHHCTGRSLLWPHPWGSHKSYHWNPQMLARNLSIENSKEFASMVLKEAKRIISYIQWLHFFLLRLIHFLKEMKAICVLLFSCLWLQIPVKKWWFRLQLLYFHFTLQFVKCSESTKKRREE